MSQNVDYISLYEYLKKPAGGILGALVYKYAKLKEVHVESRNINTKLYKGKVMLYPVTFLVEFFTLYNAIESIKGNPHGYFFLNLLNSK